MKLYEYEAKKFLEERGIPIPSGFVASSENDVLSIMKRTRPPVVVKAQVLEGSRGKGGGVIFAESPSAALKGFSKVSEEFTCDKVLIEERLNISSEAYLSVGVEPGESVPVVLTSRFGGVDVETLISERPEAMFRVALNPLIGMKKHHAFEASKGLGFYPEARKQAIGIIHRVYDAFKSLDASLVEINPLVLTENGDIIAVDAKVIVDDHSLFRHAKLRKIREARDKAETIENEMAWRGIQYKELGGEIPLISVGAGITMELMDLLKDEGSSAYCFSDSVNNLVADWPYLFRDQLPPKFTAGIHFLFSHFLSKNKKKVLVNIVSGGTPVDGLTKGFLQALREIGHDKFELVVHLGGNGEKKAKEYLLSAGINPASSIGAAVRQIVRRK